MRKWADPLDSYDGYQISPTPTQTEPMGIVKGHSTKSISTDEAKNQNSSPPVTFAMNVQDEEGSSIKIYDFEEELVKNKNDDKDNVWKSKYDPALPMMDMEKRISAYEPPLNAIGDEFLYNPALNQLEMGKRKLHFDPVLKYMGIGKRDRRDTSKVNSLSRNKRSVSHSTLDKVINQHHESIFEEMPQPAFDSRQEDMENFPPEVTGNMKSSPTEEGNILNNKSLRFEKSEFGTNQINKFKNKANTQVLEVSNTAYGNPIDKRRSPDSGKVTVYEILGVQNRPEVLDVLKRNFGLNSYSIQKGANGIRLEISPKHLKDRTNSNSLSINVDVKKRNINRQSSKKFSYDPAQKYMGLGKRQRIRGHISNYDPALQYMGLGKRSVSQISFQRSSYNNLFKNIGMGKRNKTDMGLGKRENSEMKSKGQSYDPAFQYMGLGKRENSELKSKGQSYDPAFQYMGLGKRENSDVKSKGKSYDPAFQYMGLGKRNDVEVRSKRQAYDPALQYMGLGKREEGEEKIERGSYDPAFQYMGLGKRNDANVNSKRVTYDPSFQYMGLGKRTFGEINSKSEVYDPAFQYMGLGKRKGAEVNPKMGSYDPAFHYMGLGKKSNGDKIFKSNPYDPAFQYKGLGKRKNNSLYPEKQSPGFKDNRLNNRKTRSANFDPALKYLGLGKRFDGGLALKKFDLLNMGKKENSHKKNYLNSVGEISFVKNKKHRKMPLSNYDPAFQYMGLGKKNNLDTSSNKRGKGRQPSLRYDPALMYMGLGKRNENLDKGFYDPAFKYMGLGKRINNDGSRGIHFDPALKYLGLGKRVLNHFILTKSISNVPARKDQRIIQNANFDPALVFENIGLGKQETLGPQRIIPVYMRELKRGSNLRSSKQITNYDPAFNYMGLGKRGDIFNTRGQMKKSSEFDPTLQYMGLGKRQQHPKSPSLKNSFPSDVQLLESVFADSNRVKRQIVSKGEGEDESFSVKIIKGNIESKAGDEAYPKLHRIDNIDTPRGILPYSVDDLEGVFINITGGGESYDEFEYLPLHLHGSYSKDCADYSIPCNKDPRNKGVKNFDKILFMRAPIERMQNSPELQTDEVSVSDKVSHETEDLQKIKTAETSSANRFSNRKQDSSETSSPLRALDIILQNLPKIKASKTSSTERYSHRRQYLSEIETTENSSIDRDPHKIPDLPEVKTHKASSNNRVLRRTRDLSDTKIPTSISSDAAFQELRGIQAAITHRQDESRNKYQVDGGRRAMESSENRMLNVKRNMIDIDRRPRYNPGWVFIGLGKRSSSLMETKMSFLAKCYYFLEKVHEALMRLQYRIKEFPLRLQPDPSGLSQKMKGKIMKNQGGYVRNTKSQTGVHVVAPSFQRMDEEGGK